MQVHALQVRPAMLLFQSDTRCVLLSPLAVDRADKERASFLPNRSEDSDETLLNFSYATYLSVVQLSITTVFNNEDSGSGSE